MNFDGYGKEVWPIEDPLDVDNKYNIYFTDEDEMSMSGSCSSNDCTGLIPSGESLVGEDENYNELYQFGDPQDSNYKNSINNLL